jgi:hypothetical protein
MSIIYACNKKLLRAAARAYAKEFREAAATVPFDLNAWYSEGERWALERTHGDWIHECEWLMDDTSFAWFIPYCAWCYEERDGVSDDNYHDECDLRLHYCSEAGMVEQAQVLSTEIIPKAPPVVIGLIMSFLEEKEN